MGNAEVSSNGFTATGTVRERMFSAESAYTTNRHG